MNTSVPTTAITPDEHSQQQQSYYDPYRHHHNPWQWQFMTRTVAHYERLEQIGEGTYGQVYRAVCKDTNQIVAMKKVRLLKSGYMGLPNQLIREIKILKKFQHPNLLRLIEVVTSKGVEHLDPDDPVTVNTSKQENANKNNNNENEDAVAIRREKYKGNLFLVLEYGTHDLMGLLDIGYEFTPVQIKVIFRQLLTALQHLHANKYVHRDIKSSNILLDEHFRLKLADFGLARSLEPPILDMDGLYSNRDLTHKVITLWYRPPEILVGSIHYGTGVDVWSAGCILVELYTGKPMAAGKTEIEQLLMIADTTGTPDAATWEHLTGLKKDKKIDQTDIPHVTNELRNSERKPGRLRDRYSESSTSHHRSKSSRSIPDVALNLLEKMLEWDPRKRLTAANALQNRYFWTQPVPPDNPADLGTIQVAAHYHEFRTKIQRKKAKVKADIAKEQALAQGATMEDAKAVFDQTYQTIMKQVAMEGYHEDEEEKALPKNPSPKEEMKEKRERQEDVEKGREAHRRSGSSRRPSNTSDGEVVRGISTTRHHRRSRDDENAYDGVDENSKSRKRSRRRDDDDDHDDVKGEEGHRRERKRRSSEDMNDRHRRSRSRSKERKERRRKDSPEFSPIMDETHPSHEEEEDRRKNEDSNRSKHSSRGRASGTNNRSKHRTSKRRKESRKEERNRDRDEPRRRRSRSRDRRSPPPLRGDREEQQPQRADRRRRDGGSSREEDQRQNGHYGPPRGAMPLMPPRERDMPPPPPIPYGNPPYDDYGPPRDGLPARRTPLHREEVGHYGPIRDGDAPTPHPRDLALIGRDLPPPRRSDREHMPRDFPPPPRRGGGSDREFDGPPLRRGNDDRDYNGPPPRDFPGAPTRRAGDRDLGGRFPPPRGGGDREFDGPPPPNRVGDRDFERPASRHGRDDYGPYGPSSSRREGDRNFDGPPPPRRPSSEDRRHTVRRDRSDRRRDRDRR